MQSSSSRMRVMNRNWSATKQRLHPQSVAEISRHSVLSGDRIRQFRAITKHNAVIKLQAATAPIRGNETINQDYGMMTTTKSEENKPRIAYICCLR